MGGVARVKRHPRKKRPFRPNLPTIGEEGDEQAATHQVEADAGSSVVDGPGAGGLVVGEAPAEVAHRTPNVGRKRRKRLFLPTLPTIHENEPFSGDSPDHS